MKKVFLTLVLFLTVMISSMYYAHAKVRCQDIVVNCNNGNSGGALVCYASLEEMNEQITAWIDIICNQQVDGPQ